MFYRWFNNIYDSFFVPVRMFILKSTADTHATALRSLRNATAGWRTSPESGRYTILAGWRLSARLSLIWYTFFASSMFAQSVPRCALLCLCRKSIPRLEKIRKQSSFVHLNPMRQDESGDALLLSNETIDIPSNRHSCMVYLEITHASLSAISENKAYFVLSWGIKNIAVVILDINLVP